MDGSRFGISFAEVPDSALHLQQVQALRPPTWHSPGEQQLSHSSSLRVAQHPGHPGVPPPQVPDHHLLGTLQWYAGKSFRHDLVLTNPGIKVLTTLGSKALGI